jgi:hypothetical protein
MTFPTPPKVRAGSLLVSMGRLACPYCGQTFRASDVAETVDGGVQLRCSGCHEDALEVAPVPEEVILGAAYGDAQ